jgi:serine/threonine protein kinase
LRFGGYELIEKIGVGGMAEVYKARAVSLEGVERTLVIKKILPEFATNHHFVRMLVAEARVSSMLHHPNIVQTFELGETDGQHYIAMEYVPGSDLLAVLTSATRATLRVPLGLALYIISEVCNGLDYAHKAKDPQGRLLNLIHRDISPSNVLISDDGAVKLMDFGVAQADLVRPGRMRAVDDTSSTLKGKLGYMAPEQVTGQSVDHRADLFALGIVLFETLTLKRLFLGTSDPETLNNIRRAHLDEKLARHPYIPEGVQRIIRRALSKTPAERYPDAAAFREALLTYLFDQRLRVTHRTLARFINDLDCRHPPQSNSPRHLPASSPEPAATDLHRASFNLVGLNGSTSPPMTYQAMTSLVHRRAIGPQEQVSIQGEPAVAFSQLLATDDFHRLRPADDDAEPCRQGPSNPLVLTSLLYELVTSGEDWTLHVSEGVRAKMLSVSRGQFVHADSTDPEELLGSLMLTQGVLNAKELAQSIITSAERGLKLGDALVADGTVTPHALLDILQAQLRARASELLGWTEGWYALYHGTVSHETAALEGIDGLELLATSTRTHWTLERLELLFAEHMERTLHVRQANGAPRPRHPLTPQEARLSGRLVDGVTLAEILEGLDKADRQSTLQVLLMSQRTGLLHLDSAEAAAPRAP